MGESPRAFDPGAERRAIIALLAVFALLAQSLFPSLAVAAAAGHDAGVICAAAGIDTGHSGDTQPQNHLGGGCDHCVCPVAVTLSGDACQFAGVAVRYAGALERSLPATAVTPGRGLAAPPPPSQGPPELTV